MKLQRLTLSGNDKIALISNLTTMLQAGIPIIESVDSLLEGAKGNQVKLLETLRADLMQGQRVHQTFAKFPRIFDKVTINIIKASEEAGTLDVTLKDLKENIKKEMEFGDKIRSALIYPVFILCVFVAVMLMILVVVVPKISTVFSRLSVDLPLPTKILIFLSNTLLKHTFLVVLVTVGLGALCFFIFKQYKQAILQVFYSLPVISKLAEEIDLTRFTRSLYLLLSAGIPITAALELAADTVSKKRIKKAVVHAKETVESGKKFSEALKDAKDVFPNIVIKVTEAGEKSGTLDKSLQEASEFLDYQVTTTLKTVTALIEPIMLVGVGAMIGGMMLAIIAPIYGLIGQVGNR